MRRSIWHIASEACAVIDFVQISVEITNAVRHDLGVSDHRSYMCNPPVPAW